MLRLKQHGVDQRAAGVGIDFNELGAILTDVKVVAHQHANGARPVAGNGRCAVKGSVLIGRQFSHVFDGGNEGGHVADVVWTQVNGKIR